MYSLGKMVATANLERGGRSSQTVDLQVRRWSPKEWRLGQTVDLKVRRWPPRDSGRVGGGRNGIAHTVHRKVTPVAASHRTRSAPRGDTGGRHGLGLTRSEGGPSLNQTPGGRHRQPLPSHTSQL